MEITLEQVERLREKANVSYARAKQALEYSGGNLLDALIYLEEQGDIPRPEGAYYSTKSQTPPPPREEPEEAGSRKGTGKKSAAKEKTGIARLQSLLVEAAALPEINTGDVVVTNLRHYEALSRALDDIRRVQDGLHIHLPNDLVSQDLRECLFHLAEITGGEITTDEVLGNIFKNFCVGK